MKKNIKIIFVILALMASCSPRNTWSALPTCPPDDSSCLRPVDNDSDNYTNLQGDCDDNNPTINPGQTEICGNSMDDNCNDYIDENCGLGDLTPPVKIIDLAVSVKRSTSVNLSWSASSDLGGGYVKLYDLRYSTAPILEDNWEQAIHLGGLSVPKVAGSVGYVVVGLRPETTYYFAIKSIDNSNNTSALSNIAVGTTLAIDLDNPDNPDDVNDTIPPHQVANFTAVAGESRIILKWEDPTDIDYVRTKITRRTDSSPIDNNDGELIYEGTDEQFADFNVLPNTTYYYGAFTFDYNLNYSPAALASAEVKDVTPPSDAVPPVNSIVIGSGSTIYFIDLSGAKRAFDSQKTFNNMNLNLADVERINDTVLKNMPEGEPITMLSKDIEYLLDNDKDELNNGQEALRGTDLENWDTDYDSYFDGEEVATGNDPLKPPVINPIDKNLVQKLKGYILLQAERNGQAWYLLPSDGLRYYLRNGEVAYKIMRFLSLGITDNNLEKIPIVGSKEKGDAKLVNRLKGYILLQVEKHGEAWYVNPADGHRYYLKNGEAAYELMRYYSLGITNGNLNKIPMGTLMGKIR